MYLCILLLFSFTVSQVRGQLRKTEVLNVQRCPDSLLAENETLDIPKELMSNGQPAKFNLLPFEKNFTDYGEPRLVEISKPPLKTEHQFTPKGYLLWQAHKNHENAVQIQDYCIQSSSNKSIEILLSMVSCDDPSALRIQKCCRQDELFDPKLFKCVRVPSTKKWIPFLYEDDKTEFHLSNTQAIQMIPMLKICEPLFEHPYITTNQHFISATDVTTELRLLSNGTLLTRPNTNHPWENYPLDFCLDGEVNSDENVLIDLDCSTGYILEDCLTKKQDILTEAENKAISEVTINNLHASLMVVCSIFLLASMSIYFALWEKQNLHGWTVLTYIISLFFAYLFLAISKFKIPNQKSKVELGCQINGVFAHFFFQSVFTWLTVINFDIWWKFWDMKSQPMKSKEMIRYAFYAIFAFGVPFIIIVVGLIIEKTGTGTPPAYGRKGCFLQEEALGFYLYYPIGVLIGLNFIFFSSTAVKIYSHFKSTTHVHEAKAQQELESCKVIVKLFVVMGVTWIFEFISFLFQSKPTTSVGTIVWGTLDCVNILQAVGIFFIFIWKRQILIQLSQKYPSLRPYLHPLKGFPGCKKRVDYQTSSRMTTKMTRSVDHGDSQSKKRSQRNRKLSDSSMKTSVEAVELT